MTSLTYTLVVNRGPNQGDEHRRALRFAQALGKRGHRLRRVFFYGDGADTGLPEHAQMAASWGALANTQNNELELILCSAAAERLGITRAPNRFIIAGLGSLIEAGIDSDRVLNCD